MAANLKRLVALLELWNSRKIWGFLALTFALLNLKSLPLFWHIRFFWGVLSKIRDSRSRTKSSIVPSSIFQPAIITCRNNILDCDIYQHKSNSTYFADLDISRTHLIGSLLMKGIRLEKVSIRLGTVHCNFRKEIKPLAGFEIWSRVLCWDRKWLYIVSHFVKKGEVVPRGWTLQPWRRIKHHRSANAATKGDATGLGEESRKQPHPAIFASAISKYVFKRGRLTVPPEKILVGSLLLPAQPAHNDESLDGISLPTRIDSAETGVASAAQILDVSQAEATFEDSLTSQPHGNAWDWKEIEQERQRGFRIAELMAGLEDLHDEFTADERAALGHFRDLP